MRWRDYGVWMRRYTEREDRKLRSSLYRDSANCECGWDWWLASPDLGRSWDWTRSVQDDHRDSCSCLPPEWADSCTNLDSRNRCLKWLPVDPVPKYLHRNNKVGHDPIIFYVCSLSLWYSTVHQAAATRLFDTWYVDVDVAIVWRGDFVRRWRRRRSTRTSRNWARLTREAKQLIMHKQIL